MFRHFEKTLLLQKQVEIIEINNQKRNKDLNTLKINEQSMTSISEPYRSMLGHIRGSLR